MLITIIVITGESGEGRGMVAGWYQGQGEAVHVREGHRCYPCCCGEEVERDQDEPGQAVDDEERYSGSAERT